MKLHEKAKELGVKAKDLITYLNNGGANIKSPNQELSDSEAESSNKMLEMPASKDFKQSETVLAIIIAPNNTVKLQRQFTNGDSVEMVETLRNDKFASKAQVFAHIEYITSLIEMGDYNV